MNIQEGFTNVNANTITNTSTDANTSTNANTNINTNVNKNASTNMINTTQQDSISVLTIEQFLEDLDKEYGNGIFTKYLNNFKEQEVDVLDIINFKDSDWITLGIEKIGPRSKIIRALEKYNK